MFVFWRYSLTLIALAITLALFVSLINSSLYSLSFTPNLPSTELSSIRIDTIIPGFESQDSHQPISNVPTSSTPSTPTSHISHTTSPTTTPTELSSKPNKKTANLADGFVNVLGQNQSLANCTTQAKFCRDVQCAFKDFSAICNNIQG
ncbi:2769_t:CDS:1, partial [Dentiscutata erythropus]